MTEWQDVQRLAEPHGLTLRGGFHPGPADGVPALPDGRAPGTLLLLGHGGGTIWLAFSRSAEFADGAPDPLDRWTRRILDGLAGAVGGAALYPFGGPPWLPFQRWALRADTISVSPLGILVHPDFGLWHAYRGALAFAERLDLPRPEPRPSPCESCAGRPCLASCPVDAFAPGQYEVDRCRSHVRGPAGGTCREQGCLARLACPIGRSHAYPPAQMAFHMAAFLGGR